MIYVVHYDDDEYSYIFATGCRRIEWKRNWSFFNSTIIQSFNHLGARYSAFSAISDIYNVIFSNY